MKLKKFRYILLLVFIVGIIIYNILIQRNIIDFNETIYNIVYIYLTIFIIWMIIELTIFKDVKYINNIKLSNKTKSKNQKNSFVDDSDKDKYRTSFGDDTLSKIASGFGNKHNKKTVIYCINCHREIYSSNYTGTNLCTECKKYYYEKGGN